MQRLHQSHKASKFVLLKLLPGVVLLELALISAVGSRCLLLFPEGSQSRSIPGSEPFVRYQCLSTGERCSLEWCTVIVFVFEWLTLLLTVGRH